MVAARIPTDLQQWIEARKRHRLSHAVIQMARELGLNPTKLGKIDNHKQEPWKAPLPEFIGNLYEKRFGRKLPDPVLSIEEIADRKAQKKAERRAEKARARASFSPDEIDGG